VYCDPVDYGLLLSFSFSAKIIGLIPCRRQLSEDIATTIRSKVDAVDSHSLAHAVAAVLSDDYLRGVSLAIRFTRLYHEQGRFADSVSIADVVLEPLIHDVRITLIVVVVVGFCCMVTSLASQQLFMRGASCCVPFFFCN